MSTLSVKKRYLIKKKKLKEVYKFEIISTILKSLFKNDCLLNKEEKLFLMKLFNKKKYYLSELYLFCYISGRGKSVYKYYNVSRIVLKNVKYRQFFNIKKIGW